MELVRHGLIDNRGLIVVAAGVGVLHEAGFFRVNEELIERGLQDPVLTDVAGLASAMHIVYALLAILAALIAVRFFSVVLALITLHDFTLMRYEDDLRARYGLLTKIALTLRTRRIQAVHQSESPLHRLFGRVSLEVDLAGDSGGEEEYGNSERTKTRWLAPVCRTAAAPALIASALPCFDPAAPTDWQPLAPGARSRIFRRTALLSLLLVAGPGWWFLQWAFVFTFPLALALAWMHAHLYVKHTRWALERDVLLYQSGWLMRRLTILPRDRVQSVAVSMNPFDRRRDMASLFVDNAGGGRSAGVRIRFLPADVAQRIAAGLYASASG
jgi:putative membrane protein